MADSSDPPSKKPREGSESPDPPAKKPRNGKPSEPESSTENGDRKRKIPRRRSSNTTQNIDEAEGNDETTETPSAGQADAAEYSPEQVVPENPGLDAIPNLSLKGTASSTEGEHSSHSSSSAVGELSPNEPDSIPGTSLKDNVTSTLKKESSHESSVAAGGVAQSDPDSIPSTSFKDNTSTGNKETCASPVATVSRTDSATVSNVSVADAASDPAVIAQGEVLPKNHMAPINPLRNPLLVQLLNQRSDESSSESEQPSLLQLQNPLLLGHLNEGDESSSEVSPLSSASPNPEEFPIDEGGEDPEESPEERELDPDRGSMGP